MKPFIPILIGSIWWMLVAFFYAQTRTEVLLCFIAGLLTGIVIYAEAIYNLMRAYD